MKLVNRTMIITYIVLAIIVLIATRAFVLPLVVAVVLFFLFTSIEEWIVKLFNITKSFNNTKVLLSRLATTIIIAGGFIFLFTILMDNVTALTKEIPQYEIKLTDKLNDLEKLRHSNQVPYQFEEISGSEQLLQRVLSFLPDMHLIALIRNGLQNMDFGGLLGVVASFTKDLFANSLLVAIYFLFLMMERRSLSDKLVIITSRSQKVAQFTPLFSIIKKDLLKYLFIKFLASAFTGIISYAIMVYAGVHFASFWALIIFILNFIPTIGSIIAVILPVTFSVVQFDSISDVVILAIALTAVQQAIGNIIEPRFQGKTLNLSPIIILLSLGVWGSIWGIVGMFLSVPMMVITNLVLAQFPGTRNLAILLSSSGQLDGEKYEPKPPSY